jgi:hypothetical protein
MTILEITQRKTADLKTVLEVDVEIAVEEIITVIKNYCNISEVPDELTYTAANMAADLLRYEYYKKKETDAAESVDVSIEARSDDISSIDMGDTSVKFGAGIASGRKSALNSHQASLDNLTFQYKSQLNKFRRMAW